MELQRFELMAVLTLILAASHAGAEVYKWVDEDGKVHYGDRRPGPDADARRLELEPAPSRDADQYERSLRERRLLEAFEAERAERDQAAAQAAAAEQERSEKCARVARDLAGYERAGIVFTRDESGARIYLSDEEREQASAGARAWFDKHCD